MSASPRKLYAIAGIDNDTYMDTANPGGTAGVDTGFYFGLICIPRSAANGNAWYQRRSGTASGYILRQLAAGTMVFSAASGAGSLVNSSAWTIAPSIGQVTAVLGMHTGAGNTVRLNVNGTDAGVATAITGYTPFSGALTFGAQGAASSQYDFVGAVSGPGVPSADDITEWLAACKAQRTCADMPTVPGDHRWFAGSSLTAPTDTVGSSNLTLRGSGHTLLAQTSPTWGW